MHVLQCSRNDVQVDAVYTLSSVVLLVGWQSPTPRDLALLGISVPESVAWGGVLSGY